MEIKLEVIDLLINELQIRNKSENTPSIIASLETLGPVHVDLALYNVGRTAAIDIHLKIQSEPDGFTKTLSFPLLNPNKKIKIFLPKGDMKVLAKTMKILKVEGNCKNLFGEIFQIKSHLDVKKIVESWIKGGIMIQYTLDERLSRIIEKIDRLERTLDRMQAFGGGILVKTPKDIQEEYERIKQEREARVKKR